MYVLDFRTLTPFRNWSTSNATGESKIEATFRNFWSPVKCLSWFYLFGLRWNLWGVAQPSGRFIWDLSSGGGGLVIGRLVIWNYYVQFLNNIQVSCTDDYYEVLWAPYINNSVDQFHLSWEVILLNGLKCSSAEMSQNSSKSTVFKLRLAVVGRTFYCMLWHVRHLLVMDSVRTNVRTMMTLLAASLDQGIESFHCSMRMRRATSSRNALTSSPVRAASDTYTYRTHVTQSTVIIVTVVTCISHRK